MNVKLILLISLALGTTPGIASQTHVEKPCSNDEKWSLNSAFSSDSKSRIESMLSTATRVKNSSKKAIEGLDSIAVLSKKETTKEGQLIALYATGRVYFELGYYHLAQKLFNVLIERKHDISGAGLDIAGIGCLNEIHHRAPFLPVAEANLPVYENLAKQNLSKKDMEVVHEAEFALLQERLRDGKADTGSSFSFLKQNTAYSFLGNALIALNRGDKNLAVRSLNDFFKTKTETPIRHRDLAYLLLARTYASQRKYPSAIQSFAHITNHSNYFPDAVSDMGSLQLAGGKYSDAVNSLSNLELGTLSHTFHPEANIRLASALTQLCQYPAARDTLTVYGSRYSKASEYLKNALGTESSQSLYSRIAKFQTQNSPSLGEEIVVLEWVRSPEFLSYQGELNLIVKEREQAAKHAIELGSLKVSSSTQVSFQRSIAKINSDQVARERALMKLMESALVRMSKKMMAQIDLANDSAQLLEADIYRLAGHQIAQHEAAKTGDRQAKVEQPVDKKGILHWGRLPASALDTSEVWADEVGSLKHLISNACLEKTQRSPLR